MQQGYVLIPKQEWKRWWRRRLTQTKQNLIDDGEDCDVVIGLREMDEIHLSVNMF